MKIILLALFCFFAQLSTGHSAAVPDDFATKCAQAIACWGFDSTANIRNFSAAAAFPLRYFWNPSETACNSAGLGTNHPFTNARGPGEGNAQAQQYGPSNQYCGFPTIDNSVFSSGGGSLRMYKASQSGSTSHGYLDLTFQGHDLPHIKIGPAEGGEIWHQFMYRTSNWAQNDFGGYTSLIKTIIFGGQPGNNYQFGTDYDYLTVMGSVKGRNNIFASYNYSPGSGIVDTHERFIGGNLYVQPGSGCQYGNYVSPPCIMNIDDVWNEITRHFKLNAVASTFTVSGTTLSGPAIFTNSGDVNSVGRRIYISGDGYYIITAFTNSSTVTLNTAPAAGSGKTVYISGYPNSIVQEWVNGQIVYDLSDAIIAWDLPDSGWGQFRLIPHATGKDPAIAHAQGAVWYDNFIVSRQPIAMGGSVTYPPPSAPSNLIVK